MFNPVTDKMVRVARKRHPLKISFDYVKCTNCGFRGLVSLGSGTCPDCKSDGCLQWVDTENQTYDL